MKHLSPITFPDDSVQSTASTGGGGATVTIKSTTVSVPYSTLFEYSVEVTDVDVLSTSKLMLSFGAVDLLGDLDQDEVAELEIVATPLDGKFLLTILGPGAFGGPVPINYIVG